MRKLSVIILIVLVALVASGQNPRPAGGVIPTVILPLTINGKSWQPAVYGKPGLCLGCGKVKDKAVTEVLQGTLDDFSKDFLPLDPGGKFYLYYDGLTSWRVATNQAGQNAVTLAGRVANDGTFWMMGPYNMGTMGTVFVVGKVKFDSKAADPFTAKSVAGTLYFFSETIDTGLVLKFKTGKPLA
jgi:hypothetical protein